MNPNESSLTLALINQTLMNLCSEIQSLKQEIAELKQEYGESPVSIGQAAKLLGMCTRTMRRYIQESLINPNESPLKKGIHYICLPSATGKQIRYQIYVKAWKKTLKQSGETNGIEPN